MFVYPLVVTCFERNLLDGFAYEIRNEQTIFEAVTFSPCLLASDFDAEPNLLWIMRHYLGADSILQRADDLSPRRVIFRVRREYQHYIERQTHRIALNLHVAFLQDVEKSHLNFSGQVGQLVNREDATIGARQQAIMDSQLIAK